MNWEEACHVMGVSPNPTQTELKEQYRYKNQMLHPDKTLDKPEVIRIKAEKELRQVNEAYSILTNPLNKPNAFQSATPEYEPATYSYTTAAYQTRSEIPRWVKPVLIAAVVLAIIGGIVWFVVRYWKVIVLVLVIAFVFLIMAASNDSRR